MLSPREPGYGCREHTLPVQKAYLEKNNTKIEELKPLWVPGVSTLKLRPNFFSWWHQHSLK